MCTTWQLTFQISETLLSRTAALESCSNVKSNSPRPEKVDFLVVDIAEMSAPPSILMYNTSTLSTLKYYLARLASWHDYPLPSSTLD